MKYTTPTLETERLRLGRGTEADFARVYEFNFCHLRDIDGDFAFVRQDPSIAADFVTYADEEDAMDWIIYKKDTGTPIGNITADRPVEEIGAMELSFNLHPDFWGREYMKEAAVAVMRHLFSLGFDAILCGYSEGNRKSKRLTEKLGFSPYAVKENAWMKNGHPITDYICILHRSTIDALYSNQG